MKTMMKTTMMMTAMVRVDRTDCERSGLTTQKHLSLARMADMTMDTQVKPKNPTRLWFKMNSNIGPYLYYEDNVLGMHRPVGKERERSTSFNCASLHYIDNKNT